MKTEEIIKEAIKRGYTENIKFYDAIYQRPFTIKHADFSDFNMEGVKLYVKIYKQDALPNKSACIYYKGKWAKIEGDDKPIFLNHLPIVNSPFDKSYYNENNFYLKLMEFKGDCF